MDIGPQYTIVCIPAFNKHYALKIDYWFNQRGILLEMTSDVNKFNIKKLNKNKKPILLDWFLYYLRTQC
ncbi:hypothetical protein CWC19_04240 [Pseudoalteromonas aurantia]|uniref:Uncharacterized protein n=1 Tax=Pseudoalteromonas aurantia TaxID=43654 RepID=A0A5S3VDH1_9GAMM|nr:hypothetical protein CWC19_04240 [Pseudoalteromonas aurantia]